jgi:hypothetical protein
MVTACQGHRLGSLSTTEEMLQVLSVYKLTPKQKLKYVFECNDKILINGNAIIEELASMLAFTGYYSDVSKLGKPEIDQEDRFSSLPIKALTRIAENLKPSDLVCLALTCRALYIQICGPLGQSMWSKEGCIESFKNVGEFSQSVEREIIKRQFSYEFHPHRGTLASLERVILLQQALFLACPKSLLFMFPSVRKVKSEKRGMSDLTPFRCDHQSAKKIENADKFFVEIVKTDDEGGFAIARFPRDNPDYFKFVDWEGNGGERNLKFLLECLIEFGLPFKALDPFFSSVKKGWPTASLLVKSSFPKILDRIKKDHPDVDLQGKIPN